MELTIQANGMNGIWAEQNQSQKADKAGAEKVTGNLYGGNLNLANDPIAQKKKEAQEQAWNVVKNAWENDKSVDDEIQNRKNHYAEMMQLKGEAEEQLADTKMDMKVLQELYEVKDDSQEQKDLELLERRQDQKNGVKVASFTEEERKRLEELDQQPLTEYQQRALELNERAGKFKLDIRDYEGQMMDDSADVRGIKLERLKSDPMVGAQKEAEAAKKAANDEIIGMLVNEAVDHMDEKLEENEEKAEEASEKKEEQEQQLDDMKEKRAVQEALIEGTKEAAEKAKAEAERNQTPDIELGDILEITKGAGQSSEVQQSLEEIKNSMKLLEADLKGIKVDKEI